VDFAANIDLLDEPLVVRTAQGSRQGWRDVQTGQRRRRRHDESPCGRGSGDIVSNVIEWTIGVSPKGRQVLGTLGYLAATGVHQDRDRDEREPGCSHGNPRLLED